MLDALLGKIRFGFESIADSRRHNRRYRLADCLSAGFAMFSLKDASLLSFRQQYPVREENLKRLYGIEEVCGDTALRATLDGVGPRLLDDIFELPLAEVAECGGFGSRRVLGEYLNISIDATGYFASGKVSCEHCLVKNTKAGETYYHHQLLAAVNVCAGSPVVFPIRTEPIVKQDGSQKGDCERNAAKRLIPRLREAASIGKEKIILTLDALYGNGPLLRLLAEEDLRFCITLKEGYVLEQIKVLREKEELDTKSSSNSKTRAVFSWANGLILNGAHADIKVNYIEVKEYNVATGEPVFASCWITDIAVDPDNAIALVDVGRSRWKIENETFNTLKNQGYNIEHNYGHGTRYLSSVFATLATLAFLVDQVAQFADGPFQGALATCKSKKALWIKLQAVFDLIPAASMEAVLRFIAKAKQLDYPILI